MAGRALLDTTVLARMAIQNVLAGATAPMTSQEVYEHTEVASLGLPMSRVTSELSALYVMKTKPFPLKRIPAAGPGRSQWDYYNPKVVKLAPAPVNTVKSSEEQAPFVFDGTKFELNPVPEVPPEAAPVQVPAGVKCITLTVGGVSIRGAHQGVDRLHSR